MSQNDMGQHQSDGSANSEPTIAAMIRSLRPTRACTKRSVTAASTSAAAMPKLKQKKKKSDEDDDGGQVSASAATQCTPLVPEPEPSQLVRWKLRSMWELASILNFLHVFRPVLNVRVEFTAEELETALITPNNMLADLHILLLKVEVKEVRRGKTKGSQVHPSISYQWEAVATNLDEFYDVSEKLFISKNRTEASLAKRIKNDMLPEIEKIHKRKEKLLKKQQREALLLDNLVNVDGLAAGRSLRNRKPVTYTFDDYDQSINEAIKITKQKSFSPEPIERREDEVHKVSTNGKWDGFPHASFSAPSPSSPDDNNFDEDHRTGPLDRRVRRRQRPQRYSEKDFIEYISDNEVNMASEDDIVGETVYDEEYLRKHKQTSKSSSSSELEGDEDYCWDDDNADDEEEEEDDDSLGLSEDSDRPCKVRKLPGRTRRETKLRAANEIGSGPRRSKRATRNRINYRQYELSDSETETEAMKPWKSIEFDEHSSTSENDEYSEEGIQESGSNEEDQEMKTDDHDVVCAPDTHDNEKNEPTEEVKSPGKNEVGGVKKMRFLDLNQLAPSGFDDGPSSIKDDLNQVASGTSYDFCPSTVKDDINQLGPGSFYDDGLCTMKDDEKELGPGSSLDSPSTVKDEDADDF